MGTGEDDDATTAEQGGEDDEQTRDAGGGGGVMASLVGKAKGFVTEKIAQMPKPEASLERVSFKSISREGVALHSHVDVSNPYSYRIPICELTYTFKSDGNLICHGFSRDFSVIASGTMPDPGWIGASGTTKLELPVNVPYDFVMSLMKDLSGDWDIDYVLEVGITIDLPVIGTFTIPVSTEGEMKLPTFRDLF
ncbi:unnamed protein product [Triticum turgidum subsp. durum]|uniref:Water stress and hypersensitive response domain-containing protein n=1 Tax=Triticum turgidum subsp. durum TaxID=4567 RepID=A0A9R1S239_TRITD|nr:unnamed protein product [Triticum turgidum subsp. durum]